MIGYLLCRSNEVPAGDGWLSPAERSTLVTITHAKRRADWLLGRWIAKRAMASALGVPSGRLEIRADPDGAPRGYQDGLPFPATVSISHSSGWGLCMVALPAQAMGCDVERVEPRAPVFVEDWFTDSERALVAATPEAGREALVTLIWSAKESALKALRSGLRQDTRSVTVEVGDGAPVDGWAGLRALDGDGTRLEGWWRRSGQMLISVAGASLPVPPSPL